MSEPKRWTPLCDARLLALHEIIAAKSSLNMEPQQAADRSDTATFLSEIDENVKHAYEHLEAAGDFLVSIMHQEGQAALSFQNACQCSFHELTRKPTYEIRYCRHVPGELGGIIEECSQEQADFVGVYFGRPGHKLWMADFDSAEDARLYVLSKEAGK